MIWVWFKGLSVLFSSVMLIGCMQTAYAPMHRVAKQETILERQVTFRITDAFYDTAPNCAAVMVKGNTRSNITRAVEGAVERHLATRLRRVISPASLNLAQTRLAIDMNTENDRRVFTYQTKCAALVEIELIRVYDDYLVLWAQRRLNLRLTMTRLSDGKLLWQAQHTAGRADGGFPISIIDLPLSAARAVWVSQDPEIFDSIADDAARRMMKTLPDLRGHALCCP